MRILVTGATGFIGSHLSRRLLAEGHAIIGAIRDVATWQARLPDRDWIACDFGRDLHPEDWAPRLTGVDLVINAVGIIAEGDGQRFDTVQTQAPVALFTACSRAGVPVLQISGLGAEQRGELPRFLASKRAADDVLWHLPGDCVIVHPSVVIGEGGNSTRLFTQLAALPLMPVPGSGEQRINPIHIDDLCASLTHLVAHWPGGKQRYILTGATTLSLRELLGLLRNWMGMGHAPCLPVPRGLLALAARAAEVIQPRGLLRRDTLAMLDHVATPPNSCAEWPPRPLAQALWTRPASNGLPQQALLASLRPALIASLAFVWIFTGLVSVWWNRPAGYALMASAGISGPLATLSIYGGGLADLCLGALLLIGWRQRWVAMAQIGLMLGYLGIATLIIPWSWLDPLGSLTKTLPMLAMTALLALEPGARHR